jgi:beta-1,4-mannosyltransferase
MEKKINVLFMPKWDQSNPYQGLLIDNLKMENIKMDISDYPKGLFPLSQKALKHKIKNNINIIHLHWISPLVMPITWSENFFIFSLKYIMFGLDFLLCRMLGCTIVWTIHNKFSHEELNQKKELLLRKTIFKFATRVIVHSEHASRILSSLYRTDIKTKCSVIEHGNYIDSYPKPSGTPISLRNEFGFNNKQKIFLFFGAIKPYKGIEVFIEAAQQLVDDEYLFVIAGQPSSEEYQSELWKSIKNSNIVSKFQFIPAQELIDLIQCCDAVVIPFSDTLTSGSMILAMSRSKAVILSEEGKVFGCVDDNYPLFFNSKNQLMDIITKTDKHQLEQIGQSNFKQVAGHNWSSIAKKTVEVYKSGA